ncbi:hypothetical protein D8674_042381 [Pyrus ussuriensis x Pyrus communis]|uniref:Uncharacterized protein n=1 Tax=Pyrus ussuriensis x Pyrus communis TaxID=2448454 RepID=A0A5N5FS16_9ROSA|nr:hypothetical protein D8674_042381 [Pyrus ussuriensis x Pyrus communis]
MSGCLLKKNKKKTTSPTGSLTFSGCCSRIHGIRITLELVVTRRENEICLGGQPQNAAIPNQTTDGPVGQPRQLSTNVPIPAERGSARPQPATLERRGPGNRSEGPSQGEEAASVNMTEVQRMIDSALKKGPNLFAGESSLSSLEHVARFTAQCGDVNSDFYKLRLFNFSLTGSAFAWYINLPPNSVQSWEELVEKFHEQFYRPGMEMSVSSLARMAQASDESPMEYLTRFKSARNWCRVPLPEVEFVRIALNGLDVEYKKKFLGANIRDMYELAQHVEQYDYLLREEKISKSPSRGTLYKNPTVSYASAESGDHQCVSVDAAEIVIDKPYVCKALAQVNGKDTKAHSAAEEMNKSSKVYTFDITKADAIFDQLLAAKIIKLRPGHIIPKADELKGKVYCKYHNSNKHATNNCVVFRDTIQSWIEKGKLKFPEKQMAVDVNPFPSTTIGMVDAHLPKNKGKAEYVPVQHIRKGNGRTRLKIDLFSNAPPTEQSGSPACEPTTRSNTDDSHGSKTLCDHCKTPVEPEKKTSSTPPKALTAPVTSPKELGSRRQVFDRLGPQVRPRDQASVRRRLDFNAPFYNEDYYSRNTNSSSSSADRKTFKPPKTSDQRCERPTPTIMTELAEGKKVAAAGFETTIEDAEKRIKILLRPGETRARLEHFTQEAERKLSPLPPREPFIKSLEYMREFHKKYSANDLYGLPKAYIDTAELPFSLDDLQHLRYHFEVFSAVSLFGLTADEEKRIARLDTYLDTRNARIAYEERARITKDQHKSSTVNMVEENSPTTLDLVPTSRIPALTEALKSLIEDVPPADTVASSAEDDDHDPMGPSVLEQMEISMVHVLPAEFQPSTHQSNFLDGDVVAEEATQVDFVANDDDRETRSTDNLKAALAELFPRSPSVNLQHLKPLYVTAHIEGFPISKVFVDCGATVNIMPISVMKALRRSDNELIPSGITMSSFVGDKSQTKGVLPLEVSIAGRQHMTAFFIIDSKTDYNALLGRDWIHQTSCIPSSLYQVLIFWDGKSVTVHPADNQPFETNMIQARYYDDHVGYITLQGLNEDGRPTRISSPMPMIEHTKQEQRQAAVSSTMERLLAHWYAITKQPHSGINLIEFLAEADDGPVLSLDKVRAAPAELEDHRPQVKDPLEEVNVGTADDPRILFISALLPPATKVELHKLLREFKDCFAWSYHEMPGLDRNLVEHELRIKDGCKPFRQPPRRFSTEVQLGIKEELVRLLKAGFIRTARYVEWLANIVPVLKKNGALRICIDFRNLNLATPKDEYTMPISDLLIDAAANHELLSFMDGHAGYNQIFIAEADNNLKMNPAKCAFGVSAGNFLGFLVHHRGIEVDANKARAIISAPPPTTKKQLQSLLGQINFLRRFIANSAGKMKAFSTLLKLKDTDKFVWREEHQSAFTQIKVALSTPPVLVPPCRTKPLKLYISAAAESIGCLLAQDNNVGREQAVFYLSRNLNSPELNYSPVEKLCLALFFAASKLRHYMLPSVTQVIAQTDVIRYMLTRPIVKGRIGKWTLALSEFSLQYVPQKAVKGQALADFLAQHPSPYGFEGGDVDIGLVTIRDNHWTMHFDGSSTSTSAGVGIAIQSPNHCRWYFSLKLDFSCTNNQAEYEALIIGLHVLHDLRASRALVLGDSELVINQLNGIFRCMSCTLAPYHMVATYLAESFERITFEHISRVHNTDADELAQIASGAQLMGGKLGRIAATGLQSYPALINRQTLQRTHVIRTRVMSLPSLLERGDPVEICALLDTPCTGSEGRQPSLVSLKVLLELGSSSRPLLSKVRNLTLECSLEDKKVVPSPLQEIGEERDALRAQVTTTGEVVKTLSNRVKTLASESLGGSERKDFAQLHEDFGLGHGSCWFGRSSGGAGLTGRALE